MRFVSLVLLLMGLWAVSVSAQEPLVWDATTTYPHISRVVWNADGTQVATTSFAYNNATLLQSTVEVWDAITGSELLTLQGGGGGLNGVAFSPDGTRLATGGDQGLHVYVLPISDLIQLGRSRLTRTWMPEECKRFLRQDTCPAAAP